MQPGAECVLISWKVSCLSVGAGAFMLSSTRNSLPLAVPMTSQNVCCQKGLLISRTSTVVSNNTVIRKEIFTVGLTNLDTQISICSVL